MSRTMTVFFVVLLLLAAFVTALDVGLVFSFHDSDAAGQGMTKGFAFLISIFLWAVLGGLLIICAKRGGLPGAISIIALVLYAAAAAGHFAALSILEDLQKGDPFESTLRVLTIAGPLLIIVYCLWNNVPFIRALLAAGAANWSAAVLVFVLSALPWVLKRPAAAAGEARMEAYQQERERDLKVLDQIEKMPADTTLAPFLAYADMPAGKAGDFRGAAIARMRAVASRQQEVEELLNQLDPRMLSVLGDLDLEMTLSLCEAARKCARSVAEKLKPPNPAPSFESVEATFNKYTPTLSWMLEHGCECKSEIAAVEQSARLYPESYPRKWFTDYLLDMQGKPREP